MIACQSATRHAEMLNSEQLLNMRPASNYGRRRRYKNDIASVDLSLVTQLDVVVLCSTAALLLLFIRRL